MQGYIPKKINLKGDSKVETADKKLVSLELGEIDFEHLEGGETKIEQGKNINNFKNIRIK